MGFKSAFEGLKTMSYAHCRKSFFEKFRRQKKIKSAIAKMISK
jgi:hypothetical protein